MDAAKGSFIGLRDRLPLKFSIFSVISYSTPTTVTMTDHKIALEMPCILPVAFKIIITSIKRSKHQDLRKKQAAVKSLHSSIQRPNSNVADVFILFWPIADVLLVVMLTTMGISVSISPVFLFNSRLFVTKCTLFSPCVAWPHMKGHFVIIFKPNKPLPGVSDAYLTHNDPTFICVFSLLHNDMFSNFHSITIFTNLVKKGGLTVEFGTLEVKFMRKNFEFKNLEDTAPSSNFSENPNCHVISRYDSVIE